MSRVDGPPELQPFIRETERTLGQQARDLISAQRDVERALQKRRSVYAPSDGYTVAAVSGAPYGVWRKLIPNIGPNVVVSTRSGLIRVTISCNMLSSFLSAGTAVMGAMCISVNTPFDASTDLESEAFKGYMGSFDYPTMPAGPLSGQAGSRSRILNLPPGTYTLRSEYLYKNVTNNANAIFQERTLTAEPL